MAKLMKPVEIDGLVVTHKVFLERMVQTHAETPTAYRHELAFLAVATEDDATYTKSILAVYTGIPAMTPFAARMLETGMFVMDGRRVQRGPEGTKHLKNISRTWVHAEKNLPETISEEDKLLVLRKNYLSELVHKFDDVPTAFRHELAILLVGLEPEEEYNSTSLSDYTGIPKNSLYLFVNKMIEEGILSNDSHRIVLGKKGPKRLKFYDDLWTWAQDHTADALQDVAA